MKLRGADFGSIICAPGSAGFFGERMTANRLFRGILASRLRNASFATDPVTLEPTTGNVSFAKDGYTPKLFSRKPRVVKLGAGVVLAANGHANAGLSRLLAADRWQKIEQPFFLTIASLGSTPEERLSEYEKMAALLAAEIPRWKTRPALLLDLKCPADGNEQARFVDEVKNALGILSIVGVPLVPKISVSIAPDAAADIARETACDAIWVSGAIEWPEFPQNARDVFFQAKQSPLERFGGGEVSGKYLLPLVAEWIRQYRQQGVRKPVVADGGVLRPGDVKHLTEVGSDAIVLGPVFLLRPWNVSHIIQRTRRLISP